MIRFRRWEFPAADANRDSNFEINVPSRNGGHAGFAGDRACHASGNIAQIDQDWRRKTAWGKMQPISAQFKWNLSERVGLRYAVNAHKVIGNAGREQRTEIERFASQVTGT
jgi:hypothetical protein